MPEPLEHGGKMPDWEIVYDHGNWPIIAVVALLVGAALVIGAAVILARAGDDHADE